MKLNLENTFLEALGGIEKLTPQDVTLIENKHYKDLVQYRLNINDSVFQILIKKNGSDIYALGYGEELKKKARVWYRNAELNDYLVTYNNQECKIHLDLFSFIQPFVLKPINDEYTRYIGLDSLTVFSLISGKGEK